MGLDVEQVRSAFLDFVRPMPCYGCSFFPACGELPPSGFFEYRTQNWFIGVGPNGAVVMDFDILKYIQILPWKDLSWTPGADQLVFSTFKNGRPKQIYLITPQSYLIANLCEVMKYKWAKEHGILPPKKKIVNPLHIVQTTKGKQVPLKDKSTSGRLIASLDNLGKKLKVTVTSRNNLREKISKDSGESVLISGDELNNIMVDNNIPSNHNIAADTIIGSDAYLARKTKQRKQNRQRGVIVPTTADGQNPQEESSEPQENQIDKTHAQSLNFLLTEAKINIQKPMSPLSQTPEKLNERVSIKQETSLMETQKLMPNAFRTGSQNSRRKPSSTTEKELLSVLDDANQVNSFGSYAKPQPKEKFSLKGAGGLKQRSSAVFHMDSHIGGLAPVIIIDKRESSVKRPNLMENEVRPEE